MIEFKEITKKYSHNKVLDGASLIIARSNITLLHGKNGSGKTTLIRIIANLTTSDAGEIYVDNEKIEPNSYLYKKNISFYIGAELLIEQITVLEYLEFIRSIYKMPNTAFHKRVEDLLQLFELPKNVLIKNFSKGMKTKAALCGTFLIDTDYLILDEPFENLDTESIESLIKYLQLLKDQGKGILLTTHNLQGLNAFPMCNYILEKGQIRELSS